MIDFITVNEYITEPERFKWYARAKSRSLTIEEKVDIIELFVYKNLSIVEISHIHSISYQACSKVINLYFEKPPYGLSIMSKI